jgi:hypothetical protein
VQLWKNVNKMLLQTPAVKMCRLKMCLSSYDAQSAESPHLAPGLPASQHEQPGSVILLIVPLSDAVTGDLLARNRIAHSNGQRRPPKTAIEGSDYQT